MVKKIKKIYDTITTTATTINMMLRQIEKQNKR